MRLIPHLTAVLMTFLIGVSVFSLWNIEQQSPDIQPQRVPSHRFESGPGIKLLVSDLSSDDEKVRIHAERTLIAVGQESAELRTDVVQALLWSVATHEDLNNGRCFILGSKFSYWDSVTNIFAELRATEAIDLLIRTIHCNNGFAGSLQQEPSFDALVKMGQLAVPQLAEALKHEPGEFRKLLLSECLSVIQRS